MTKAEFVEKLNTWGKSKIPFLFLVDFEIKNPLAVSLNELDPQTILFDINGFTNAFQSKSTLKEKIVLFKFADHFKTYKQKFDFIKTKLIRGDSFLINLTSKTEIKINKTLEELFTLSRAKYKLWWQDQFLVFSPEIFVQIHDQKIFSYPMKGTINASLPNAREILLNDVKELAEHTTIVDLIRNDLSLVATNVQVTKFRYVEEVKTTLKNLLQVSSEIEGKLPDDYLSNLGTILISLLPAGSVSGAPKAKTIDIIRQAEGEDRGFYTGVIGYFDGQKLDSGVVIRYIEKQENKFYYRSGGGVTAQSLVEKEYQEMLDKIYVPVG